MEDLKKKGLKSKDAERAKDTLDIKMDKKAGDFKDDCVQEFHAEVKEMNERIKKHADEKKPDLTRYKDDLVKELSSTYELSRLYEDKHGIQFAHRTNVPGSLGIAALAAAIALGVGAIALRRAIGSRRVEGRGEGNLLPEATE